MINLVYGSGAEIGDAALAARDLAGVHFTGSTAVFQGMWKTIGDNIERYRNYPRIVGETGGKDFIVAHPSADVDAVAGDRPRRVRVPGPEVLGGVARLRAVEPLARAARAARGEGRGAQGGRRRGLRELHGRGHRPEVLQDAARARSRRRARTPTPRSSSAAASTTAEGFFVEPTVIATKDPNFRTCTRSSSARS